MPVRVLIADDHALFRKGLRTLLDDAKDIEVVGEASDGEEAVRLAERLKPDVVLMDITMPGVNGIEATRRIRTTLTGVRVIALTMHTDRMLLGAMRDAGATAFQDKDSDFGELVEGIVAVAARGRSPANGRQRPRSSPPRVVPASARLTPREREVLSLLAVGLSTKGIAFRLGIGPKTVETHRARVMAKLGIDSVAGLTKFAITRGYLPT
jgi:DNA-binding NarL/FixJ family response regulator